MTTRAFLVALALAMLFVGVAGAQQFPLLDMIADKVVQKYQQSSCEQLWLQKAQPKSAQEQNLIQMLHSDPQMRTEFLNRVAAPMANKMFECGMIP
jgi:LPS O-antigen subunit length determinant protein (WzzB/FepE family)